MFLRGMVAISLELLFLKYKHKLKLLVHPRAQKYYRSKLGGEKALPLAKVPGTARFMSKADEHGNQRVLDLTGSISEELRGPFENTMAKIIDLENEINKILKSGLKWTKM